MCFISLGGPFCHLRVDLSVLDFDDRRWDQLGLDLIAVHQRRHLIIGILEVTLVRCKFNDMFSMADPWGQWTCMDVTLSLDAEELALSACSLNRFEISIIAISTVLSIFCIAWRDISLQT